MPTSPRPPIKVAEPTEAEPSLQADQGARGSQLTRVGQATPASAPGLRSLCRSLPVLPQAWHAVRARWQSLRQRRRAPEQVFNDIFARNAWSGDESVSGLGSSLAQTRVLIEQLPPLLRRLQVRSMLDIPCGDFHWMRHVELGPVQYTGADIVAALIERNRVQHRREGVRFEHLDLLRDALPRADLVFCRDCLVHLPYDKVRQALANVCRSGSTWLLATTFPKRHENADIATGQWRPLNLQAAPFALPPPAQLIDEGCTENGGAYADKAMGLWRVADIEARLHGPTGTGIRNARNGTGAVGGHGHGGL